MHKYIATLNTIHMKYHDKVLKWLLNNGCIIAKEEGQIQERSDVKV